MLNITNGTMTWFDCHFEDTDEGKRMMFGARVNPKYEITSAQGTILVADNMRVLPKTESDRIMSLAIQKNRLHPKALSKMFGIKTGDAMDMSHLLLIGKPLTGCRMQRNTLITRSKQKFNIDPEVWDVLAQTS